VALFLICGGWAGCAKKAAEATAAGGRKGGGGTVPVVVAPVVKKEMPIGLAAIGAVESVRSVPIKSLVTGTLMAVHFQEGQEVRKGDLLFEIDSRPFENALRSAEADLQKTTAQLETAEAEVERYSNLVKGGMVSKEQYQNIQNTASTLRATMASNQAAIANAKLQLEYCTIRAPFDGRTGSLGAHEGDLVRASDPNIALVVVTQMSPIYVTFALPQQNLSTLQHYRAAGPIAVLAHPTGPDAPNEKGELSFLDSAVDATSGTINLKATFANRENSLWPGQFVSVDITLARLPNQIVVPTPALQVGQRGQQVYVVRADNTAELRPVVVDRAEGGESIVSKGLAVGEVVVIDGQVRLRPNAAVAVKPPVEDVPSVRGTGKGKRMAGANGASGDKPAGKDKAAPGPTAPSGSGGAGSGEAAE
jgi:multidrug efflux system membrane fusion protein